MLESTCLACYLYCLRTNKHSTSLLPYSMARPLSRWRWKDRDSMMSASIAQTQTGSCPSGQTRRIHVRFHRWLYEPKYARFASLSACIIWNCHDALCPQPFLLDTILRAGSFPRFNVFNSNSVPVVSAFIGICAAGILFRFRALLHYFSNSPELSGFASRLFTCQLLRNAHHLRVMKNISKMPQTA